MAHIVGGGAACMQPLGGLECNVQTFGLRDRLVTYPGSIRGTWHDLFGMNGTHAIVWTRLALQIAP